MAAERCARENEETRRSASIHTHEAKCDDVQPNIDQCNETFKNRFAVKISSNKWRSYRAMVNYLEERYGRRPIEGWICSQDGDWTAPCEETWKPLITPDIQDLFDIHTYADTVAHECPNRNKGYDAYDAWTRWFYPLKHFYYEAHALEVDGVGTSV